MDQKRPNRSFEGMTARFGLLVALCCSPLLFLFASFGDTGKGTAAMISAALIVVCVRYFWDLRKRVWFWVTIVFIGFFHLALVLLVPWPDKDYRGIQLLPIGVLDFGTIYGIIRLVEWAVEKVS